MRKSIYLIVLITLLTAFFVCSSALAGPVEEEKLRKFFEGQNVSPEEAGEAARAVTNDELFPLVNKEYFKNVSNNYKPFNPLSFDEFLSLAYGDKHGTFDQWEYRYIGYTNMDEAFTNFWFRPDFIPRGGFYIHKAIWISNPRKDYRVVSFVDKMGESPLEDNPFLPNNTSIGSRLRPHIQEGLKILAAFWPEYYKFDVSASPIQDWENYVHILQPPSFYCFGTGRMFHQARDGSIWYLDVPLLPGYMLDLDFAVELEKESYQGNPGEKIETTAYFTLNSEAEFPETAKLKLYLETAGGITELPFTPVDPLVKLDNNQYTFSPGEVLKVKFSLTVPGGPSDIEARIDRIFDGRTWIESNYDNNRDRAPIIMGLYDIKVKIYADEEGYISFDGESTTADYCVRIARKDVTPGDIDYILTVKDPSGVKTETLTLGRGYEDIPFNFEAGAGSYTIEAEAWPVGINDVYPNDNRDVATVTVESQNLDIDSKIRGELIDN